MGIYALTDDVSSTWSTDSFAVTMASAIDVMKEDKSPWPATARAAATRKVLLKARLLPNRAARLRVMRAWRWKQKQASPS